DGSVGYRCAGEPVADYVRKGGTTEDTAGRKCLCNGLLATISLGQNQDGYAEPALITAGNDVAHLARYMPAGAKSYRAADVLRVLLTPAPA
ncbi:MAG TPA: nitronate monooxygenase, partial [Rariglobus sp.]